MYWLQIKLTILECLLFQEFVERNTKQQSVSYFLGVSLILFFSKSISLILAKSSSFCWSLRCKYDRLMVQLPSCHHSQNTHIAAKAEYKCIRW